MLCLVTGGACDGTVPCLSYTNVHGQKWLIGIQHVEVRVETPQYGVLAMRIPTEQTERKRMRITERPHHRRRHPPTVG